MKLKCLIPMLILLALIQVVIATPLEECTVNMNPSIDIPCMIISTFSYPSACNSYNMTVYNATPNVTQTLNMSQYGFVDRCNVTFNITTLGSYTYNISNGGESGSIIISAPQDDMAGLAIMGFVTAITALVFFLPWLVKRFSDKDYLDKVIKGACIALGLFLLALDTAMLATIADHAGIALSSEIFRYLYFISRVAYFTMVIVVLRFGWQALQLWKFDKHKRDQGDYMDNGGR